jgi:hypothetical protein
MYLCNMLQRTPYRDASMTKAVILSPIPSKVDPRNGPFDCAQGRRSGMPKESSNDDWRRAKDELRKSSRAVYA